MSDFVESTKEASRGGFAGILAVRGLQVDLKKIPPPEGWETTKYQMQLTLEDATILKMREGEEEFELKEGKFTCMWSYANEGKVAHANGVWVRTAVASAEAMGKKPSEFTGQYVTLEKIPTLLFKQHVFEDDGTGKKRVKLDENGDKVYEEIIVDNYFCYMPDETADSENIKDYIRGIITGLNQKAALRKLLVDSRAKQFPEFKEALNNGTLADMLELTVVDEKFQKVEEG